ncbi:DUF3349 domain-containing protein [Rothia sp. P7181]|uniref:DUF3349 domain-containing protein n=1 Tax=unclassified Rothia (in: high G+C Gram-positive bacteria) TaxID=2689056 RepID=UPI003AE8229A
MPQRNIVSRVIDWLSVGYPEDVPVQDRAAVMAVLRRRLTDAQLEEVIRKLMLSRAARGEDYVSDQRINEYIRKVTDDVPTPEEIDRVARILGAHGLHISENHFSAEDSVEETDTDGYVEYINPSEEEKRIAESAASRVHLDGITKEQ